MEKDFEKGFVDINPEGGIKINPLAGVPQQWIEEKKKTPAWYLQNLRWGASFYNRPVGNINFPSVTNQMAAAQQIPYSYRERPVQFMIRMMMYYLGQQPNLDYNHLVQDITTTNMQAQWIKGQDVSEFVNYFKGSIMSRVANAWWTAKVLSEDAYFSRLEMRDKLLMKVEMKAYFDSLKEMGISFDPAQNTDELESEEDVDKWMDENFQEKGADVCMDLANGIWFSNDWVRKSLQGFMHTVICNLVGMEHIVENGKNQQRIVMPYQIIKDTRIDDDFGTYDQFRGKVSSMSPNEVFTKFKTLTNAQKEDIEKIAKSNKLGTQYNTDGNIQWWYYSSSQPLGTVTVVEYYFKGFRGVTKKSDKDEQYKLEDIQKVTVIGNKYIGMCGYIDNLVEEHGDKTKACFPILIFQPNTFMGQSVSEVARIHKLQDELDMLDFKIREMIGKAKGKVYILRGEIFNETTTPKEFFEDIAGMGVHIAAPSGEDQNPADSERMVEMIDWSLDPNINKLAEIYNERKARMSALLSTSPAALGQQTQYLGLGTYQNTLAQNSLGVAYLMDGYMDFLVMNMRYATNQAKNLFTQKDGQKAQYMVGDKGIVYLQFTKDMRFEDLMVVLNVNDVFDAQSKTRVQSYLQSWSQNPEWGITPLDILEVDSARSYTQAKEGIEYSLKKGEKRNEQRGVAQQQSELQGKAALQKQDAELQAALIQLKEDNANFRATYTADMAAIAKGISDLTKAHVQLQQAPPISPLENQQPPQVAPPDQPQQ